ncbi:hypothetical protein SAMN04244572_00340 [Azotobacter beijerinckii]|uniref:Uncharacterized protein n=1 Tax=Azotobacter beijerinckii TaxID=170623 RepID=A0A1H6QP05_9GAMM|nr:hypothetical protein SAMN04244572_00340 [Azotobacter beijerinckii]
MYLHREAAEKVRQNMSKVAAFNAFSGSRRSTRYSQQIKRSLPLCPVRISGHTRFLYSQLPPSSNAALRIAIPMPQLIFYKKILKINNLRKLVHAWMVVVNKSTDRMVMSICIQRYTRVQSQSTHGTARGLPVPVASRVFRNNPAFRLLPCPPRARMRVHTSIAGRFPPRRRTSPASVNRCRHVIHRFDSANGIVGDAAFCAWPWGCPLVQPNRRSIKVLDLRPYPRPLCLPTSPASAKAGRFIGKPGPAYFTKIRRIFSELFKINNLYG